MAAEKEKEKTPTNLTDLFSELLHRKGPRTPSEILVYTAKERDLLYDVINRQKEALEDPTMDDGTKKFTEDYIAALSEAKTILTARIQFLLSKT